MEKQYECLFRTIYTELSQFNEEDSIRIAQGEYPIILAKDGVYTKLYVSDDDLDNYGIFDATIADKDAQKELHGPHVPIVWVRAEGGGMTPTGIEPSENIPTEE